MTVDSCTFFKTDKFTELTEVAVAAAAENFIHDYQFPYLIGHISGLMLHPLQRKALFSNWYAGFHTTLQSRQSISLLRLNYTLH